MNGVQPFTVPELDSIAAYFDVPVTDLFGVRTGSSSTHPRIPGQLPLMLSLRSMIGHLARTAVYREGGVTLAVAGSSSAPCRRRGLPDATIMQRRRVLGEVADLHR